MKEAWLRVASTVTALGIAATGATWWLAPGRFVRIYRRIQIGDPVSKTAEWERMMRSASGRAVGVAFFVFGCIILWVLYWPHHSK
jgi:hypothetical protein